jgi:hypothetical protein
MGNAPDAVKRLVDHFDRNRKVFLSGDYKEEQLRAEFLNSFFTALCWDIDDTIDTIRNRIRRSVLLSPVEKAKTNDLRGRSVNGLW